jgi:hypothetical protein
VRRIVLAAAAIALAGLIVCTHAEDAAKNPPPRDESAKSDVVLNEMFFDGLPLDRAIDQLSERTRVTIIVDWPTIEAAGVHRDASIRLRLYDIPLKKALELVLTEARDPAGAVRLGFQAGDDGVIHVSTIGALAGKGVIRLYDVHDLIEQLVTETPKWYERQVNTNEATDSLIRLTMETVSPESWKETGGGTGTIWSMYDHFLIEQSPENQRQIEWLLYNLRRVNAARARGEKPTTHGVDLLAPPTTEPVTR